MPVTDRQTYERRRWAMSRGNRLLAPVHLLMFHRVRAGMSRQELANASGVAISTVYKLEHGTWAQWATRELIADALGVDERELRGSE